jgi:hypothetical protein
MPLFLAQLRVEFYHSSPSAGALHLLDAYVNISHSFLGWNKAHRNGGAMFVGTHETDKSLNSTLRLVNTTFDTNLAEATGGERFAGFGQSSASAFGLMKPVMHSVHLEECWSSVRAFLPHVQNSKQPHWLLRKPHWLRALMQQLQ